MSAISELSAKLASEGEKLISFFNSLTDDDWNTEIYTEGTTWTIRNVLSHFVTAERAFLLSLFPNVVAGGTGATEEFSIDRFNARQQEKTLELTPNELLAQYKDIRSRMVEWVNQLQEEDLEKSGRHPFIGWTNLGEMIKMVYVHNLIHYRDVKRVIRD
jgi:uncharacterized damage-inducible protein DinB